MDKLEKFFVERCNWENKWAVKNPINKLLSPAGKYEFVQLLDERTDKLELVESPDGLTSKDVDVNLMRFTTYGLRPSWLDGVKEDYINNRWVPYIMYRMSKKYGVKYEEMKIDHVMLGYNLKDLLIPYNPAYTYRNPIWVDELGLKSNAKKAVVRTAYFSVLPLVAKEELPKVYYETDKHLSIDLMKSLVKGVDIDEEF